MNAGTGREVPHILIIEDDAAHRDLILRAFRDDPDTFRLSVAGTLRAAREILERDRPDLILSDWILPDGKGLDILPRTDGLVTIPLIIMTSFGDERLAVEIMKSGAIDYVVKSATMFRDLPHIARRALADWENILERKRAEAAVQETQKRIADILNFLPDAVLAIDNEGTVIGWNHAIERMTGVMAADMLGKGDHEHSLPFYGERRPILIDLVLMDDKEIEKKYDFIQRDNGRITSETFIPTLFGGKGAYLWGTASPLFDSAGNRTGAIEVIRDITDRKQAEETLQKRDAVLETLLNAPNDTIALLDRQGIFLGSNTVGARRLGKTIEEVTGKCAYDLLPPDVAKARKEKIDRVFETGETARFDDFRAGMYLHNEVFPIFNPEHRAVDQVAIFARDITDQKKAEHALQESEKKYRFLIDNVRDIIWQTTPDLAFTYVSAATETLTGYLPDDLIGISLFKILTEPSARVVQQRLEERMEDYSRGSRDLATVFEAEIRKKDGGTRWFEISSNAVFGPDGTIAGFQGISRDITDRKRAETALVESEVRFHDLFHNMSAGVAIYEPTPDAQDFIIRDVNRAVETIERVKKDEIVGKSVLEVFPGVVEFGLFAVFQRVARTGVAEVFPVSMYHDNRIAGWRENYVYKLPSGEVVALYEDVTGKKQVEEERQRLFVAVQEEKEKLSVLLSSIADEVWFTDLEHRFTLANPRARQEFQLKPGEQPSVETLATSHEILRQDGTPRPVEEAPPLRALSGEVVRNMVEIVRTPATGELRYRQVSSAPVRDSTGTIIGSISVVRDITEQNRAEHALQESEARYRRLFDASPDGIVLIGTNGLIGSANLAQARMFAYESPAELVGISPTLLIAPAMREFSRDTMWRRIRGEEIPGVEYRLIRKDGTEFWGETTASVLRNADGTITGYICITRDTTERRRVEKELQATGYQLSTIYRNISEVLFFLSVEQNERYRFLTVNQPFLDITGLTREQVIGRYVDEVIPEPSLTLVIAKYKQAILENTTSTWEEITEYPVGIKWGEVRVTPLFDTDGRCTNLVGSVHDITERKLAEIKLRESEERYRSVIENAAEGITVAQDGILQYANARLLDMIEAGAGEIASRQFTEFIHPDDRAFVFERYQRRVSGENVPQNYDFRIVGTSGKITWVQLSAVRIEWNGRPATLNFLMDITERKQAEERLRESRQILEGILNTIPVRVFWKDKNLTYLGCNAPFAHDAGFEKPGDIIGKNDYFMAWREQAELYQADDRAVIGSGNAKLMIEEPQTTPAGDTIYLLTSKLPLRDARGDVIGVLGTYLDITDRKKAEELLRESEERYRALLNGAGIGVGYWGLDGTLLFLNEISFKRLRGTASDFIGKNVRELFGENAEMYLDRIRKAADSPDPMEYEDLVSLPVGKGWYLSVYTRICRPDGSVMGIQVLSMDITPRKQAEEIRKAYESRLDSAMEIGSLAWWEMDLPDGAVRFDDRKATMLGYPPAQFMHYRDFTALLHPDDQEPAIQAMKDHLEDRQSRYHIDYRIRTAAGNYRWFRDVGGITRHHPDGSPATVTGIVIDITASRQAEEALRATENRYRALIQNSSDIIRILDRDGLIVYESESAERILGYPKGYMIGKNPMEYIHPDDVEHVKKDFGDVIDRINPGIPTEFRICKADGAYIWVDSIGTNLLDVPGVNGIVITTRPIQQRKETEQALRESEARLATAMDIAGLVNWEFDVASGMFTFDDRFYALYETTADREGGNLMSAETYTQEFVYPDDRPAVLSKIHTLLATTDPAYSGQMEHRITPRDGSVRTIIARYVPVMGPDGKVIRVLGANQDITDFKLMESEIRSLNTVLEQRVRDRTDALAKTNEALEEEVAQRQETEKKLQGSYDEKVLLLKEIHHRVKNNLQIIASLLNLQSRYIKDESTLAAIRESQNRVKAMALVHEKLYRSEDISHVSLHDYIRFLGTGLFQFYDAKLRGIQFTLDIHEVNVDIDAAIPLGLILNELISNSLKYAFPEGRSGEIAISVKKEDHTITVLFRDNGIGIPADLDWRDTQSLGLRLVNTLVDQMNGTVDLDRSSGTLFTMVLHEKEQKGSS
jgi:PAS domain S-box-containing protein